MFRERTVARISWKSWVIAATFSVAAMPGGCSSSDQAPKKTTAPETSTKPAEKPTKTAPRNGIEKLWSLEGFKAPESVLYDSDRDVLYVSNINGSPTRKNHLGFLSRVSPGGEILDLEWIKGLNAPKGLARSGNRLFVADIDTLVEIDIDRGAIVQRHHVAGARFLNDTTADADGTVYVSDMLGNAIYRLAGDDLERWVKDDALASPNGLLIETNRLVVGCWGAMTDGWTTEVPGHLKTISLMNKQITSLGSGKVVGNLDGLEADGTGSYLATDYTLGRLVRIHPDGTFETLLKLHAGSADLEYLPDKKQVFIPQMNDGRLDAYQLP